MILFFYKGSLVDIRGLYNGIRKFEATTASDKGVTLLKSFTATSVVRLIGGGSLQESIVMGSMAATISLIEAIIRPIITSYVIEPYIKPNIIGIVSRFTSNSTEALRLQKLFEGGVTILLSSTLAGLSVTKIQNVVLSRLGIIPQPYSALISFGVTNGIRWMDRSIFGWKEDRAQLTIL